MHAAGAYANRTSKRPRMYVTKSVRACVRACMRAFTFGDARVRVCMKGSSLALPADVCHLVALRDLGRAALESESSISIQPPGSESAEAAAVAHCAIHHRLQRAGHDSESPGCKMDHGLEAACRGATRPRVTRGLRPRARTDDICHQPRR